MSRLIHRTLVLLGLLIALGAITASAASAKPSLETTGVFNITSQKVRLKGTINPNNTLYGVTWHFEYGKTTSYGSMAPSPAGYVEPGASPVPISTEVSGLTPETLYHYRLVGENHKGEFVTADSTFTTLSGPKVVTKNVVSGGTWARLRGEVNPNSTEEGVIWGFEYGPTSDYGTEVPLSGNIMGPGKSFEWVEVPVTGLKPETKYHFRIAAVNDRGEIFGEDKTFTTGPAPTVTTANATGVDTTSGETVAELHANVNPNSTTYGAIWGFEYGPTVSYGSEASAVMGPSTTAVPGSIELDDLEPETTYHYRAVVTNYLGESFGEDKTFTTPEAHEVRFNAGQYPGTIVGAQQTALKLTTKAGEVTCEATTFTGSVPSGTTQLGITPQNASNTCVMKSGGVTVGVGTPAMNGCEYVLEIANEEAPYSGSTSVICPSGKAIEFVAKVGGTTKCTLTIPAQTGLSGMSYSNLGSGTEREVEAGFNLTGIRYQQAEGEGFGRCKEPGEYVNGTYAGSAMLTSNNAASETVGLYISGSVGETPQPRLESEGYPATLSGQQGKTLTLTTKAGTVTCSSAGFSGSLAGPSTQMLLTPTMEECSLISGGFTTGKGGLVMNGCEYSLGVSNAGPPYEGTFGVVCPAGKVIEFAAKSGEVTKCTIKIGSQSGLAGTSYTNVGKGKQRAAEVGFNLSGIKYSQAEGEGFGRCKEPGEYQDGTFTGSTTLKAENGAKESLGLFVAGAES